jgi:hypothetical protein
VWLRAGKPRVRSLSPGRGKIFVLSTSLIPVLGPTQPPISGYRGSFPRGVKLTTYLQLVPRSRIRGYILPLRTSSWHGAEIVKHKENFTFRIGLCVCASICNIEIYCDLVMCSKIHKKKLMYEHAVVVCHVIVSGLKVGEEINIGFS